MKRLNRIGERGSPCGSPMNERNRSVRYFPDLITKVSRLYIKSINLQVSYGNPSIWSFMKSKSRLIVSKHLVKSIKHTKVRFLLHSLFFRISLRSVAAPTVERFLRNPNCQVGIRLLYFLLRTS